MKPIITIDFVDFWPTLIKTNNYIYNLLSKIYTLEISSKPEVLFYSVYGKKHLEYNCLKILYCAENKRPDFWGCDYALSFDLINHPRHFRWPLYAHHIDLENAWEKLINKKSIEDAYKILHSKSGFCCMVVSNGNAKERIKFYTKLSKYKKIDSGGRFLNNINKSINDKMSFIKNYKFVISFENSSHDGYTTEKIIQPFITNSIPIYWGNKKISLDFNTNSFINANESFDKAIQQIIELDKNEEKYVEMLMQPVFNNNVIPKCCNEYKVLEFLQSAIDKRHHINYVSKSLLRKKIHIINLKKGIINKKIKRIFY